MHTHSSFHAVTQQSELGILVHCVGGQQLCPFVAVLISLFFIKTFFITCMLCVSYVEHYAETTLDHANQTSEFTNRGNGAEDFNPPP